MNFNHDTGSIDTLLSIDTTTLPPLGGTAGVFQFIGTGALIIQSGTAGQQPTGVAGALRFNTTSGFLEYYNGSSWYSPANGTVTSVAVSGSTGLSVSGSPITTSGTITLTLGTELQGLSALASSGIVARTGSGTYAARTIAGTGGRISVSNGDGVAGAPTIDLVTAGSAITDSLRKITTDAYGRVTASTAVGSSDVTTALGYTPINKAGDTAVGSLTLSTNATITVSGTGTLTGLPAVAVNAADAASKAYVDSVAQGLDPKGSVKAATTAAGTLASSFANGSTVDGVTLTTGDRILIKNQASASENGIYTVNASGAPTRSTDMDAWTEVPNAFTFVEQGTSNGDTGWLCTSDSGGTLGSTSITFVQFTGAGSYSADTGLTLTGNTFSITSPVATTIGGTGLTSIGAANQMLGVNSGASGLEYKTMTAGTAVSIVHGAGTVTFNNTGVTSNVAGTGISVSGATGAVTITNTGVTSLSGTTNQITASAASGAVTLSLPSAVTISSSLTVSGLTAASFLYSGTAGLLTTTAAPTNGQLLIGSTGAAPVAAALTAGTAISVTNGAGSITINNTGVTALAGTTNQITASASTGSITLSLPGAVTLATSLTISALTTQSFLYSGVAGLLTSTAQPTAGQLLIGVSAGTAPTVRTLQFSDLSANAIFLYRENPSSSTAPTVTGANSVALGTASDAKMPGMMAFSAGSFTGNGDAQTGIYVFRNSTTNNTATDLFLNGSSTQLVLQNNSLITFSIIVAARRTDSTGGGAGYELKGCIRRDANAASTTLVGAVSKSTLGETNSTWDANVTADTVNGGFKVTVTGEAAKTIRWVATAFTTEVRN